IIIDFITDLLILKHPVTGEVYTAIYVIIYRLIKYIILILFYKKYGIKKTA
ncbi:hypothetical protein EV356DRAFT_551294, partial [Viridothelium virens]